MSAMSVLSDRIFTRLFIASAALAAMLLGAAAVIIALRLATPLYVPGWTSLAIGLIAVFLAQIGLTIVTLELMMFNNRATASMVPAKDWRRYVQTPAWVEPAVQGDLVG